MAICTAFPNVAWRNSVLFFESARKIIRIRESAQICNLTNCIIVWNMQRRMDACVEFLKVLPLETLITTEVPFDDVQKAYQQIDTHPEQVIQTILKY